MNEEIRAEPDFLIHCGTESAPNIKIVSGNVAKQGWGIWKT